MPPKLRAELANDPFYKVCCVTGSNVGKIEWHHNATWQGRQLQERFAILPILKEIHIKAENKHNKTVLDWIMLNRATDEDLEKYSKTINYIKHREALNKQFGGEWQEGKYFRISSEGIVVQTRTLQQNKALHLFFDMLAKSLNDAGLDQRAVLKPSVSIPWTKTAIKEQLWRPIQKAMYAKHSTTNLMKQEEIDQIHATLTRHLAEKFGVEYIPFPSYAEGYMESAPLKTDEPKYNR